MPKTKGSKNRSKTTHIDYASQIAEKQDPDCRDCIHHRQH